MLSFDERSHNLLISILSRSKYIENYINFCQLYSKTGEIDGPSLNLNETLAMFKGLNGTARLSRKPAVFSFGLGLIAQWEWQAKLVVQRYGMLEPMLEGACGQHGIGSTLLDLAIDAGDLRTPPVPRQYFLPPTVSANRPWFDGDMRTMERMIPDLVCLFEIIMIELRQHWPPDVRAARGI